ncbi:MAG: DUF1697 domain-containing protein [Anaerolineae bacterium]|nr:DUF1697 domain-containing protein [Anaerolineae bacterium]
MTTYIALLRGINVGGHKKIKMEDLRAMYEALGFENVASYVQSGNVVFDSAETKPAALAARIEAQIAKTFGHEVLVFIRDADDLRRIIAGNPFADRANINPARLMVAFLNEPLTEAAVDALAASDDSDDEFVVAGKEIYLYFPDGSGRSKLAAALSGKKLGTASTTRNWNTVTALADMASRE